MKERPIIFSGPMVRAILDGRKTQTRRVFAKQPPEGAFLDEISIPMFSASFYVPSQGYWDVSSPYGIPGDHLWVRETWQKDVPGCPRGITYRADHQDERGDGPANPIAWRSPIFMPRAASRITLAITNIRVERLQDIDIDDIEREGIRDGEDGFDSGEMQFWERFSEAWNKVNSKRAPWESNPWVWVIEFRRKMGGPQ